MFTDRNGIFFSSSSFYGSIAYKAKIVNNLINFNEITDTDTRKIEKSLSKMENCSG